jgi:hypothetical protein
VTARNGSSGRERIVDGGESAAAIEEAVGLAGAGRRAGAGRPKKGEVRPPKIRVTLNRGSNRHDYLLARLTRDANDGVKTAAALLQGVRNGVISVYAAGAEMSYCRRREPLGTGSENAAKRRDWALHKLLRSPRPDPKALIG